MGKRKRLAAEARKEVLKTTAVSKLNNCPTSPRKMRLMADMIRGKKVEFALNALKFSTMEAAGRLRKVLLSALANWQAKNEGARMEDESLYVKEVFVDSARQLKRLRTAPQGRGHRVRKRSNHITMILDTKSGLGQTTSTEENN